jgi:transposase InsO family protein
MAMPWIIASPMSQRHEFVLLAGHAGANVRQLCRRFGISAKTGYKWLQRFRAAGISGLSDRSRRPRHSPGQCAAPVAAAVVALRCKQPTWGARKLRRRLQDLGHSAVPAASTCTAILRRADLIHPAASAAATPWKRFERAEPNELWQMDFKGHFATQSGARCHALALVDDHSRFNVVLAAAGNERAATVRAELWSAFSLYGLPEALLCDNGPPWGCADPTCPYTSLTVWLLRLGVRVLHGRPYHPQTQGKQERFNRTLEYDLLRRHTWRDLAHCQVKFAEFRHCYNCERPNDAVGGATPISCYRPSVRAVAASLPPIEYPIGTDVVTLAPSGVLNFRGQKWYVGKPFSGLPIGLRPSAQADGQWEVFFSSYLLGCCDLNSPRQSKHLARSIYPSKSI